MYLAIIDILPPIPSLWAIIAVIATVVLYKKDSSWFMLTGVFAVLGLLGWFMSVLGWAVAAIMLVAVVAALLFIGKGVIANKTSKKSRKKKQPQQLTDPIGDFDIESLLLQNEKLLSKSKKF